MAKTLLICGSPGVGKTTALFTSIICRPETMRLSVIPGANVATKVQVGNETPLLTRLIKRQLDITYIQSIRSLSTDLHNLTLSEIVLRSYWYDAMTTTIAEANRQGVNELAFIYSPEISSHLNHHNLIETGCLIKYPVPMNIYSHYPDNFWIAYHSTMYHAIRPRPNLIVIDSFDTFGTASQLVTGGIDIAPIAELEAASSFFGPETMIFATCRLPLNLASVVIGGTQGGVFVLSRTEVFVIWPFDRTYAWLYIGENALSRVLSAAILSQYRATIISADVENIDEDESGPMSPEMTEFLGEAGIQRSAAHRYSQLDDINDLLSRGGITATQYNVDEMIALLLRRYEDQHTSYNARQGNSDLARQTHELALAAGQTQYHLDRTLDANLRALNSLYAQLAAAISRGQLSHVIAREAFSHLRHRRFDMVRQILLGIGARHQDTE